MKGIKKNLGVGFSHEKDLFGCSLNGYSVGKFKNGDEIKVALHKNGTICNDDRVFSFKNQADYENWHDEIHYGKDGFSYLQHQDCGLIARAYPSFYESEDE